MRKIVVDSVQNASSTTDISFYPSQATTKPAVLSGANNRYEDMVVYDEVGYFHGPENSSAVTRVTIPLYDSNNNPITHRKLRVLYDTDHANLDPQNSSRRAFDFYVRDSNGTALTLSSQTSSMVNFYNNWANQNATSTDTSFMRLMLGLHDNGTDTALANHLELNIFFEPHASHYQFVLYGTSVTQRSNQASNMGAGVVYTRGQVTTAPANLTFDVSVGSATTDDPISFKVIDLYEGA